MQKIFLAIILLCLIFSSLWATENYPTGTLSSIETLTNYLIKYAPNDKEKVRAIYRWIALNIEYDTQEFFSGQKNYRYADPAENAFRNRKSVCEGYARLFKKMCDIAGIQSEIVSGWSKGYGYEIGSRLPKNSNHAWNVVWLNGKWQFIESTWGSGTINETTSKFVRQYTDYWFLTSPEQFIFTHYPEEAKWQLLEKRMTVSEWQGLANFSNDFFKYGFNPQENKTVWLRASGTMAQKFTIPEDVAIMTKLSPWQGSDFANSYTFEQRNGKTVEIITSFPTKGTYELKIFAKYKSSKGSYEHVVSYRVEAESGNNKLFAKNYEPYSTLPVELLDKSPIYAKLESGYRYYFKLNVPEADSVAIIQNNDNNWQYLERQGQTFEGWVDIKAGLISVSARLPAVNDKYHTLLEYVAQ